MQNNPSILVLDKNKNSREVIKGYLEDSGFAANIELFEDYSAGYEKLKTLDNNSIVIMDITSEHDDIIKDTTEKIRLYTSKLIICSSDYSTNTIVKALRIGAKEFLPKPIIKEDLLRILSRLTNIEEKDDENSQAKIITIYSNKGGIGKTTIAVNLALELAKVTKVKVSLVDLNLQLGDVSTFLNLTPAFDVNYVIRNMLDKDESVFLKTFEKYKDTSLYVLADPSYIEQSESISPQQITELFKALKKVFSYIVVDMSANIDANSLKILDCSDWIIFTTIVNIPAIRNAQRCLTLFRSRRYPKNKVKVIINRFMDNDEIKIEDIENTLGENIYWKVPNNYFTIMEAVNKGMSVAEINAASNVANNFRDFASKVSDDIIEQEVIKYRI